MNAYGSLAPFYDRLTEDVDYQNMADHYERATDETNDSPYSNTYEDAPANPGEYYDPNEQQ